MSESDFLLEEVVDRLMNLVRKGQVFAVNQEKMLVRVKSGGLETGWLQVFSERAGKTKKLSPLDIGETVVIFSPMGDTSQGIVLRGLYTKDNPPPESDPEVEVHEFSGGLKVRYDREKDEVIFDCRSHKVNCDNFVINCKKASITNGNGELVTLVAQALQSIAESKTDTLKGPNPLLPGSVDVPGIVGNLQSFSGSESEAENTEEQ